MTQTHMKAKNREIKYKPILLVIFCTIFTSAGQIFFKLASQNLNSLNDIFTNYFLILGFISYGLGSVLMIIALKYGDLSLVYPFVALSFVWVTLLSIILFEEMVYLINWFGIIAIIVGVSLIGYGSSKEVKEVKHG
jgi:uncharacterized membrane protein